MRLKPTSQLIPEPFCLTTEENPPEPEYPDDIEDWDFCEE